MCGLMISKPIGLLYISDVIIKDKIIRFYKKKFIRVISLTTYKMIPGPAKAMESTTDLGIIF